MLSPTKHEILMKSITSVARKVYEAVPLNEPWSHQQITSELSRTNQRVDFTVVSGCLASLINSGLVQEQPRGQFIRKPVRDKRPYIRHSELKTSMQTAMDKATNASAAVAPTTPFDAIERLGSLANKVSSLAADLATISKELEDIALDVEEQRQSDEASSGKLRQLQVLLKSLT